jgi:hypothetical protein
VNSAWSFKQKELNKHGKLLLHARLVEETRTSATRSRLTSAAPRRAHRRHLARVNRVVRARRNPIGEEPPRIGTASTVVKGVVQRVGAEQYDQITQRFQPRCGTAGRPRGYLESPLEVSFGQPVNRAWTNMATRRTRGPPPDLPVDSAEQRLAAAAVHLRWRVAAGSGRDNLYRRLSARRCHHGLACRTGGQVPGYHDRAG